jgi:hypothetical protein
MDQGGHKQEQQPTNQPPRAQHISGTVQNGRFIRSPFLLVVVSKQAIPHRKTATMTKWTVRAADGSKDQNSSGCPKNDASFYHPSGLALAT